MEDLGSLVLDHSPWWKTAAPRLAASWPERRDLHAAVMDRVLDADQRRATVILGPRHVGKSVLLLQIADDLLARSFPPGNLTYFDFSDDRIVAPITVRNVLDAANRVRSTLGVTVDAGAPQVLLLDEISRVQGWDRWLKGAVDRTRDKIVATDSAAGVLRTAGRETGFGRWDEIVLEGLSYREFVRLSGARGGDPLARYLDLGGFPEFVTQTSRSHVRRTLREDVAYRAIERDLLGLVDDVEAARGLFVYLVQDSGASFNASQRCKDLGANRKQVSTLAQLFLDTRLLVSLPMRALDRRGAKGKASHRLGAHPRIYAADHGLIHAFSPLPDPYSDPEVRGQIFEGVVFRHLRDLLRAGAIEDLAFHRERDGLESDFVAETVEGPIAIEVTGAAKAAGKVERLRTAADLVGSRRPFLVYGGTDEKTVEGVRLLPLPVFLNDPGGSLLGERS